MALVTLTQGRRAIRSGENKHRSGLILFSLVGPAPAISSHVRTQAKSSKTLHEASRPRRTTCKLPRARPAGGGRARAHARPRLVPSDKLRERARAQRTNKAPMCRHDQVGPRASARNLVSLNSGKIAAGAQDERCLIVLIELVCARHARLGLWPVARPTIRALRTRRPDHLAGLCLPGAMGNCGARWPH